MKWKRICSNRMKKGIALVSIFLLSLYLETDATIQQIDVIPASKNFENFSDTPFLINLNPHEPIEIISDENFTDYGFSGSGNETHPYVIENYNITTINNRGIYVKDTSKNFLIRNCYLDTGGNGIRIECVAEKSFLITDNICVNNNSTGIWINCSTDSTIKNNFCKNNDGSGIYLFKSSNSTLTNNTCEESEWYGIMMVLSSGSTLTKNFCQNNDYHGIWLNFSPNSTLDDNICINNERDGIYLDGNLGSILTNNHCFNNRHGINLRTHGNILNNNTCSLNSWYGIFVDSDNAAILTYNTLQENDRCGIYLSFGRNNNSINHNNFIDNNPDGSSQAADNGEKNEWYDKKTKEGNFWSDLGSECMYIIDGVAQSKDKYPLNRAQSCPNPVIITTISIVIPLLVTSVILVFFVPKFVIHNIRKRK